jgi:hypothetical protein
MTSKNCCRILLVYSIYLIIYLLSSCLLYSQQDDFIKSIFRGSDLKKLEKTKSYEIQAEQLIEEANELYMETYAVQGDYELNENQIEKKVNKLEKKAQKKQIEAATYYELINQTKFGIYKSYIEKFWSDFEGDESDYTDARHIEEQSNDLYFQASTLRSEASKISDQQEKVENLNNAYELEIKSLEKQLSALSIYYGIEYTPSDEIAEQVSVDVADIEETEPVQEQLYYEEPAKQETEFPAEQIATADTITEEEPAYEEQTEEQLVPAQYEEEIAVVEEDVDESYYIPEGDEVVEEDIDESYYIPEGDEVIFRVQIAASRIPLTRQQLSKIYKDNYPVEMIEEEGWFKYQILGVRLFSEALRLLRSARVKGAFIIAYDKGVKQNLYIAVKRSRSLEQEVQTYGRKEKLNNVEWHVQIAASRIPLTKDDLSRIYRGNRKISLIIEEGWYKYRLKAGISYSTAKEIKQQCGVPKAFIVSYHRAKKDADK